jgi:hypothetical protein
MIQHTILPTGVLFDVCVNGAKVSFDAWRNTDDDIYYFALATLVDNGNAELSDEGCLVPFESLYLLSSEDCQILGLPQKFDKAVRLCGDGMLNSSDFRYRLEFLTHVPDGTLLKASHAGNILTVDDTFYLLTAEQYALVCRVEQFNSLAVEQKTTDFNLRTFADVKQLAEQCGCQLDSYLANENVCAPTTVKLELGRDATGFTIKPSIDSAENEQFQHAFERMRRVPSVYPLQNERGERNRIVLDCNQREGLGALKQHGTHFASREDIKPFIDNPTEYFDPELFDLSEFYSDRVIELGIYKPKFSAFVSPYKSDWIVGAEVETASNGTTRFLVKDQDTLDELERQILLAEEARQGNVEFQDASIDIDDARYLARTARRQLEQPKTPVESDSAKYVLIIEENTESLGYSVVDEVMRPESHYTLFANEGLLPAFSLKAHQQEGVAWLQHLYLNKAAGCLLADDMGLGKTLQILYFIDWIARSKPNHKPFLIVAPVSLLENWEQEYSRFFASPRMEIVRLSSREVPRKLDPKVVKRLSETDVILTNYESLRNAQQNFCAVDFEVVVLDEAQKIKTPGTLVTNTAKALKSDFRIAMTGTPVENSLLDLWCIMDFCVPGLLGNYKQFASQYQLPLGKSDTDLVELGNTIHSRLGAYFMRRMKSDVAKDLPRKIEVRRQCEMPDVQRQAFVKVRNRYEQGIEDNMLITIMNLRAVSDHPYLYKDDISAYDPDSLVPASARMIVMMEMLDEIRTKGEKVIVFVERKEIQRALQRIFYAAYGIVAKIINGDTPASASASRGTMSRQQSIDAFQAVPGFNIIIMSPVAAGMGLNVTAANHVIHYSRHWNPAKESQATDRAYRIGQQRDVYVYYPMAVCRDFVSFDMTLDELLSNKTMLATSTIFPTERTEVRQAEMAQRLFG